MVERGSKWSSEDYPWDVAFEVVAVYEETKTGDVLYCLQSEDGTIDEWVAEASLERHWERVYD